MAKEKIFSSVSVDSLSRSARKANLSLDALRVVRTWLSEQIVAQEYAKLGQGGHKNTQVPLRRVFVDLPVTSESGSFSDPEDRTLFLANLSSAKPIDLKHQFRFKREIGAQAKKEDEKHDDTVDLFESNRDQDVCEPRWAAILLVGGPGQGKSTLGQIACQLHRAALLVPVIDDLTSTQRDVVNSFNVDPAARRGEAVQTTLPLPINPLLPLQIVLPDFAAWAAKLQKTNVKQAVPSLLAFLADLPSAKAVGLDAAVLFELICAHPSLLVLDGFDEVGATQDRDRIVTAAKELLGALAERAAHAQILATTRPQGYADELAQVGINFQKMFLAPLSRAEALTYASKLIEAKMSGADQQAKALRQIHEAAEEPATERLLTTPLQVTILTALVQHLGRAPRERWNLFSKYFAYTYEREIERDTYASPLLREHRAHIERIHARVALLLQVEAERDGGASARMSKERLEQVIRDVLIEDEFASDHQIELIRDIAAAAENRLVFLVEPEPGKFGFEIRSLQEFMAAWALTSGRDAEIEARLTQVAKAPMFRNVALFIASKLFSEGSPLRDILADRICGGLDAETSDPLLQLSKAGSLLALETLEEGAALAQPKRARALMMRAVGIFSLPAGVEHIRLARIANSDTTPVLVLAIENGLGASEEVNFCRASAWLCLIDAINRNEAWAIELGNKYWTSGAYASEIFRGLNRAHVALGRWVGEKADEFSTGIDPYDFVDRGTIRPSATEKTTWMYWLSTVLGAGASWHRRHRNGVNRIPSENTGLIDAPFPERMPPASEIWQAWIAVGKFYVEPSAENLAKALEFLALGPSVEYWERLRWRAPWPLACCIASANKLSDFQRYAKLLKAGKLGALESWIEAEKKWPDVLELGLILEKTSDADPWSSASILVGPPLFSIPVWLLAGRFRRKSSKEVPSQVIGRANEIFVTTKSKTLKVLAAEICLSYLGRLPARSDLTGFSPLDWIKAAPESAALFVPRPKVLTSRQWRAMLDACTPDSGYHWMTGVESIFRSLRQIPAHPVLLRIATSAIGFFAEISSRERPDPIQFRDLIVSMRIDETHSVAVAADIAVLKIFAGANPPADDELLIESIKKGASEDGEVWQNALGALKTTVLPPARVAAIIAQLYTAMGASNSMSQDAMKEIRDSLQKRTSDLDSRATWDRLALPLPYPMEPLQAKLTGGIPTSPVRIKTIELANIGGIEKLYLETKSGEDGVGQWVVIVGPNGSGKTTVLRALALALRSVKHPSIWPKGAFAGVSWQRILQSRPKDTTSSHILVTLGDGVSHRTLIRPSESLSISQLPEQDQPRLFPIFAYGCRRGSALGGAARQVNLDDDDGPEIATLFDEGASLIQAETWLVALEGDVSKNVRSKVIYESVTTALKALMNFDSIDVFDQRLWVTEAGKERVPFACLSDGYLTNSGWFLDLVARWLKFAERHEFPIDYDFLKHMRGLVLIDEIDLHLHPQWQVDVIARTRAALPSMSFVVTTHNPLTLVGAKAEEIWMLERGEDGVTIARSGAETPMFMTGGQIYRQYFGIKDIYPNAMGRVLQRYSYLSGYALRDDAEQRELDSIQAQLAVAGIDPGWDIVPRNMMLLTQPISN